MRTIFIGGSGRCGTKLLRDILGAHSKITALPYPTRFTIDPDGLVDTYIALTTGAWSPYIAGVKIKRLWNMMMELKPNVFNYAACYVAGQQMIEDLICYRTDAEWSGGKWQGLHDRSADIKAIMADFMQKVTASILEKHGGEIYVDSNTWNPLFTPELLELCPDSIHIHIYRDPRDVVDSMAEQRWCPDDKLQCAQMYSSVMEGIRPKRTGLQSLFFPLIPGRPMPQMFEVSFDVLLNNNTEYCIQLMCEGLGIDYEPAMLKPIDAEAANIGRYKADPIFETTAMMEILQPHMERYGYE